MDKITFTPSSIRGGGDVLDNREVSDFTNFNSDITSNTQTVLDTVCTVFHMDYVTVDAFSAFMTELNTKNITYLVKNLSFVNGEIIYTQFPVSNIATVNDLVGVVYNLQFDSTNHSIIYDSFTSDTELNALESAVTSLSYNSTTGDITFETVGDVE